MARRYTTKEIETLLEQFNLRTPLSKLETILNKPGEGIISKLRTLSEEYPEIWDHQRTLEYEKEYRQRSEVKKRKREYSQRPEVKEKKKEYNQRPEAQKKRDIYYIINFGSSERYNRILGRAIKEKVSVKEYILNLFNASGLNSRKDFKRDFLDSGPDQNLVFMPKIELEQTAIYQNGVQSQKTHEINEEITKLLDILTERERTIIKLRYGFNDGTNYTLEEIGNKIRVSRSRIGQLKKRALNKLRIEAEARGLEEYLI